MAFNWRDFATGALEQANIELDEKSAEAKEYKQRQRDAATRNASVVQTRTSRAQQAAAYGKQALQLMKSDPDAMSIVQTAMASGMGSITELYEKLNAAANAPGQGGVLGKDDIAAIISMPNIPTTVYEEFADVSLEEFAKLTYGAKPVATTTEPKEEMGFVGKLFGFDEMNQVDRELAKEQYGGGMSIAEINQLAAGAEYTSLIPDATMTFKDRPSFGFEQKTKFTESIIGAQKDALDRNEELLDDLDPIDRPAMREIIRKKAAVKVIDLYVDQYKDSGILENTFALQQIKDSAPEGYINDLLLRHGKITQEEFDAAALAATSNGNSVPVVTGDSPVVTGDAPAIKVDPRPEGLKRVKWDNMYKGRYDPITGEAIIVTPRPDPSETRTERRIAGGRTSEVNLSAEWDKKYKDTHDPLTGQLLPVAE